MEFKRISFPDGQYLAYLDDYPSDCPSCHQKTTPNYIYAKFNDNLTEVSAFLNCPNPSCQVSYVANYVREDNTNWFHFHNIFSIQPQQYIFNIEIEQLSPLFVKIYNEAYFAEQNNLFEICGVGYRKALEFLIKDYLIKKNPSDENTIKEILLGKCINDFVQDSRIKETAKRAAWLGNDHAHYIKKWEEKELSDLKLLIKLAVNWIESELWTDKLVSSMS